MTSRFIGRAKETKRINGHTLEEVVARYLRELDNPAPDYNMRAIYLEWMIDYTKGNR